MTQRIDPYAPCPCGSGKKFKFCCQGKPVAATRGPAQSLQGVGELLQRGQVMQAEAMCRQIVQLQPGNADALHLLGLIAGRSGRYGEGEELIAQAIRLNPQAPAFRLNLGNVYQAQGRLDDALAAFEEALRLKPDFAEAYLNLGNLYRLLEKPEAAIQAYQRVLALRPEHPEVLMNLGNVYQQQGLAEPALDAYRRALARKPDSPEGYFNLGKIFQAQECHAEAIASLRQAIALRPSFQQAHRALATSLNAVGQFAAAQRGFEQALALRPDDEEAQMNLGGVFMAQGRMEEAVAHYARALEMAPGHAQARSNLLLALQYASHLNAAEIFAQHRLFGTLHETGTVAPHGNVRDKEKRIRIGYVSPDFRQHSVAYFAETVMSRHDHTRFEVYGYYSHHKEDAVTARFRGYCDHWRNIEKLGDDEAADLIRADGIDLLVDLAGHTGGNRLPVFARKPAPVQATWLGHPNTTGLTRMDYRITDSYAEPQGLSEHLNTETLWRLPEIFCCYTPCAAQPERVGSAELEVMPTPALRKGHVTFGCFNNIAKVSPQTVALWSRLLRAIPDARLILEAWWLDGPELQQQIRARFAAHGIDAGRLTLLGRKPEQQYVLYHEVDIALDPFPCTGGTTSFDALWMGVPLVTLAGDTFVTRMGLSLLSNLGLPQSVARDEEQYLAIAQQLTRDLPGLNALRLGMRKRMEASPLMDAGRFAVQMETAYRRMWETWCTTDKNQ